MPVSPRFRLRCTTSTRAESSGGTDTAVAPTRALCQRVQVRLKSNLVLILCCGADGEELRRFFRSMRKGPSLQLSRTFSIKHVACSACDKADRFETTRAQDLRNLLSARARVPASCAASRLHLSCSSARREVLSSAAPRSGHLASRSRLRRRPRRFCRAMTCAAGHL